MELRQELVHPLFVHFPIAMLIMAVLFRSISFWIPKTYRDYVEFLIGVQLFVGLFVFGMSLFTGDIAADIVKFQIAEPIAIQKHEDLAYQTLYVFLGAAILEILAITVFQKRQTAIKLTSLFVMAVGTVYLVRTSHSGAELVYELGAGVRQPNPVVIDQIDP